jgi:trk system potassium uptake protein TrkA
MKLTEDGHEVFGVDSNPSRVDMIQNKINHAHGLDASDESCINYLPIDDCDLVVIAIGENIGASVTIHCIDQKTLQWQDYSSITLTVA